MRRASFLDKTTEIYIRRKRLRGIEEDPERQNAWKKIYNREKSRKNEK